MNEEFYFNKKNFLLFSSMSCLLFFFLMFGRNPNLPVDIAFGIKQDKREPQTKYVQRLRKQLLEAYKLALNQTSSSQEKQKNRYDIKTRGSVLQIGDKVLVKRLAFDGKHKLTNYWEDDAYIVIDQPNSDIPVYKVRKENNEGKVRTLHRNLLLPIGFISEENMRRNERQTACDSEVKKSQRPVPKPRKSRKVIPAAKNISESESESSSSDDELWLTSGNQTLPSHDIEDTQQNAAAEDVFEENENLDNTGVTEEEDDEIESDENTEVQTQVSPQIRRSNRIRKPPDWLSSGNYVTKSATGISTGYDWKERADFAMQIINSGILQNSTAKSAESLFKFILKSSE